MTGLNLSLHSPADASAVTRVLTPLMDAHRVFCFQGPMGAGKTTIIRQICRDLGAREAVSSPTFSLVNEYRLPDGRNIAHMDLFRVRDTAELMDIGWEEYMAGPDLVFLEWPENAATLIPEDSVTIIINPVSDTQRNLSINIP